MKKLFHKSHKENPSDSFHNDFIIFEVVTFAHIANQRIVSATRDLSSQNLSDTKRIYSCSAHRHPDRLRKARSEPAAFQLIPDSGKKDRFNIPLEVSGSFAFEAGPGTFYLTSTGSDITLASRPFTVNGINSKTPVQFITRGPLYTDLRLTSHCPFRCLLASDWNLRRCHDNAEIATADIDGTDLYFFFGSSTVPISIGSPGNLHNASSIHVKELIQRVLPVYADIAGKSWAEVEPAVVQNVAAGLWEFGEIDFRYDTSMGASSFLAPNGTFWLGNMLRKTISQCNCFDLAAFVYTAFKSFGRRVVRPGQEVDVSWSIWCWYTDTTQKLIHSANSALDFWYYSEQDRKLRLHTWRNAVWMAKYFHGIL